MLDHNRKSVFFAFYALVCDTPRQKRKRQEESIPRRSVSSCLFPAYRAGKVLRLHFSNGEAAASGLVDTGNGHKGLGIDLRDQIAELV